MNENDILFDFEDDENPPPVQYPQQPERVTRVTDRLVHLQDYDFEFSEIERLAHENDQLHQAYQGVLLDLCTLLEIGFLTTPGLDIMPLVKARFEQFARARAEFATVYAETPVVFQARLDGLKRILEQ